MKNRIKNFFWFLNLNWWLPANYPVSVEQSLLVNELINDAESGKIVVRKTYHTYSFEFQSGLVIEIWTENYPYAYGYTWSTSYPVIPDRKTRRRLYNFLQTLKG